MGLPPMDFGWTPFQVELYENARAFARAKLRAQSTATPTEFSRERWSDCAAFGLTGLCIPQDLGGSGLDAMTTARVLEACGSESDDLGTLFSVCAHLFAAAVPIAVHASHALRSELVPQMCAGTLIGANAITEPEAGSDALALRTRATPDGSRYVLRGSKSYVTNGPVADIIVVYAATRAGYLGLNAFALRRSTPGLSAGPCMKEIGLSGAAIGPLYLDDCEVDEALRIGADGQGALVFNHAMRWGRACLFALYLGVMRRTLEETIRYARERMQFGRPIGSNQAISHRIVEMKFRLECACLLLYRACWLLDRGEDSTAEVALSKLAVSEGAILSALDAIRVHGGLGIASGTLTERALRDAVPAVIFSGTSEIQREIVAQTLGLTPMDRAWNSPKSSC